MKCRCIAPRRFDVLSTCARRFFNRVQDYAIEDAMYRNTAIKPVLPDLFAAAPNGDGAVRARSGYVFPPFLVMERGMTLAEWLQAPRDSLAVLSMFKDCAALLATLHAAGHVHRDLKPDNVLLMLQTQAWRLIDFGIAAPAGALRLAAHCVHAHQHCTGTTTISAHMFGALASRLTPCLCLRRMVQAKRRRRSAP